MEPLAIVVLLNERLDVVAQVIEILVLVDVNIFPFRVVMKLSQLALSYGFGGRLMLGIIPYLRSSLT